jgi:hypothetical protein
MLPSLISVAGRLTRRLTARKAANAKAAWDGFTSTISRSLGERGSTKAEANDVFSHVPKG